MKILHILQSSRFSGAENVVCQIISLCSSDRYSFVYSSRNGEIKRALDERNIEFKPLDKMSVLEIKRVIKEVKPDVIHAHDMKASFYAALACGDIPLISHIHNNAYDSRKISLKSILYFFAAKKAKHIFWVSQSSYDGYIFHKALYDKSSILYNIIDINALKEKMKKDKKKYNYDVVYLGRLTSQKNPHRLIDVFEKIIKQNSDVKLAIIGTGELEEEIRNLIHIKSLEKNIELLGYQVNPYRILHDSKVMLMTSRWEGTPMCALEAMSLGVPIVSTPTDGLKDIVKIGVTGYLSDSNEKLSAYCLKLISDKEIHESFSRESISYAQKLMNIDNYKSNIIGSYKNAIELENNEKNNVNIMFVTTTLSGGGAERVISVWASELAERGYSVTIMLSGHTEKEYHLSTKVQVKCVATYYEEYKKLSYKEKFLRKRKIIKLNRPQYIISFLSQNRIWTFLCTLGIRCKKIETIRNSPWHTDIPGGLSGVITKLSFRDSYRIILQSSDQVPYFSKEIQKKTVIISNPISEIYLQHYKKEFLDYPKTIIAVGRLVPQKNYFMMIDAFTNACQKNNRDFILKIFGEESCPQYIEKIRLYIHEKGMDNKIFLMGKSTAIEDEYSKADIYLMSSDFEGMPNSLAEAMASKLICISTDCKTGPRDLINDKENGFLVPTGDSNKMTELLLFALNMTKNERIKMGESARSKIMNYCSKANSVDRLAKIIDGEL